MKMLTLTLSENEMACVARWAAEAIKEPKTLAAAWIIDEAVKAQCLDWLRVMQEPAEADAEPPAQESEEALLIPVPKGTVFQKYCPMSKAEFATIWNRGTGPTDFLSAVGVECSPDSRRAVSQIAVRLRKEGLYVRRGKRGRKRGQSPWRANPDE